LVAIQVEWHPYPISILRGCGSMDHVDIAALRQQARAALEDAVRSRQRGNEGRARVSARRAAGFAIAAEAQRHALSESPQSALALLRWYAGRENLDPPLREAAHRLTVKVRPDFRLPHPQDPLQDAARIVVALLGEEALPKGWDWPGAGQEEA